MANIIDSYSETNHATGNQVYAGAPIVYSGQAFTGDGSDIGSAVFYTRQLGSPTGNAFAEIYAHTGTFGTSSKPTGSPLATSDARDVTTFNPSVYTLETFVFSGANQITLTAATNYVVVITFNGGNSSNRILVSIDNTAPTHGGNQSYSADGSTWSTLSNDVIFYVYDNDSGGSSSIKKLSGVAQASLKKVSSVAEASIKKISGVAN